MEGIESGMLLKESFENAPPLPPSPPPSPLDSFLEDEEVRKLTQNAETQLSIGTIESPSVSVTPAEEEEEVDIVGLSDNETTNTQLASEESELDIGDREPVKSDDETVSLSSEDEGTSGIKRNRANGILSTSPNSLINILAPPKSTSTEDLASSTSGTTTKSPRTIEQEEKRKQKLRQFFGTNYDNFVDLLSAPDVERQKKLEKLTKFFGERPGDKLLPTELLQFKEERALKKKEKKAKEKQIKKDKKRIAKLALDERTDSKPSSTASSYSSSPSLPPGSFSSSSSVSTPRTRTPSPLPSEVAIKVGDMDFVPEPGSAVEQAILQFLEDKIKEPYGVAFGVKRGACSPPCDCKCYTTENEKGGPCTTCKHFPGIRVLVVISHNLQAKHSNLGKADPQQKANPISELKNEIEFIKKVRGNSISAEMSTRAARSRSVVKEKEGQIQTPVAVYARTQRGATVGATNTVRKLSIEMAGTTPAEDFLRMMKEREARIPITASSAPPERTVPLIEGLPLNPINVHPTTTSEDKQKRSNSVPTVMQAWIIDGKELTFTQKLGVGSSAKVFKGLYRGQQVAIKVLKSMPEGKQIDDFKQEFEIMSSLRSPHVVYFYGAVIEPKVCIVMEYCSRGSLYDVLKDETISIDWNRLFGIIIEAVKGILCLHSWKPQIVHRDLKSLNLLIDDNWTCKVADFGLSRFLRDGKQSTLGKLRGTYAYCAPEVYFGEQYSAKSDIYSLGIITWEIVVRCLKGVYERPYSEYNHIAFDFQIILQTAKNHVRPTIPPNCPPPMSELIQMCWAAESEKRPDCYQLLSRLTELKEQYERDPKKWTEVKRRRGTSALSPRRE